MHTCIHRRTHTLIMHTITFCLRPSCIFQLPTDIACASNSPRIAWALTLKPPAVLGASWGGEREKHWRGQYLAGRALAHSATSAQAHTRSHTKHFSIGGRRYEWTMMGRLDFRELSKHVLRPGDCGFGYKGGVGWVWVWVWLWVY